MKLETLLNEEQCALFQGLNTPMKIQEYLDTTQYRPEYSNLCPLQVIWTGRAHCLDGGIFGAAALKRLGYPALLVDIFSEPGLDDDHVLAIFKRNGRWGAVAKSNFAGLRYREPVYRDLRELVMSYFEPFYNVNGQRTLRTYTPALSLAQFDRLNWETTEAGVNTIEKALLKRRRIPVMTEVMVQELTNVDSISYRMGLSIANPEGLYQPKV
jgi:hypothetical protein